MDKFEEMLNEVVHKASSQKKDEICKTLQSGGYIRNLTISYEKGNEEKARFASGCKEEDAYAALFAVGKFLGELTDIDGDKIGCELVKAAIKIVAKQAMDNIFEDLKELL